MDEGMPAPTTAEPATAPTLRTLFLVFLGFGLRAWGGPAAQIAMIRDETRQRQWIGSAHFNRLLAVYQILPGPEATEMCVHLGFLQRGRIGAVLAGLAFMLPGFVLMLLLAWGYVSIGQSRPDILGLLAGFAPAVAALVVAASIRLGKHVLHDQPLVLAALVVAVATAFGVPFYVTLLFAGLAYATSRKWRLAVVVLGAAASVLAIALLRQTSGDPNVGSSIAAGGSPALALGISGLKAGLLTFGGAYTAIPFVQGDAVGRFLTQEQFLDGLALSGILPAPLIIFATFVGFVGGGWAGALAMTFGIFLPAFAFTLLGHRYLESLANHVRLTRFLDGVAAGVIGILGFTAVGLTLGATSTWLGGGLLVAAFAGLLLWKSRWATPVVVLGCGAVGALVTLAI
jgi:chromate transporter